MSWQTIFVVIIPNQKVNSNNNNKKQSYHGWKHLEALPVQVTSFKDNDSTEDFILLNQSMPRSTELQLSGLGLDWKCWRDLSRNVPEFLDQDHRFGILEQVALVGGDLGILCSLQNADILSYQDRPWVCLGLRRLFLSLKFGASPTTTTMTTTMTTTAATTSTPAIILIHISSWSTCHRGILIIPLSHSLSHNSENAPSLL